MDNKKKPFIELSAGAVVGIVVVIIIIVAFIVGTSRNGFDNSPSGPQNNSPEECTSAC